MILHTFILVNKKLTFLGDMVLIYIYVENIWKLYNRRFRIIRIFFLLFRAAILRSCWNASWFGIREYILEYYKKVLCGLVKKKREGGNHTLVRFERREGRGKVRTLTLDRGGGTGLRTVGGGEGSRDEGGKVESRLGNRNLILGEGGLPLLRQWCISFFIPRFTKKNCK